MNEVLGSKYLILSQLVVALNAVQYCFISYKKLFFVLYADIDYYEAILRCSKKNFKQAQWGYLPPYIM